MAGAWGAGIATFAGDRVLEVFYPDPQLGTPGAPASASSASRTPSSYGLPGAQRSDDLRDVRQAPVLTRDRGPRSSRRTDTADAYLRLHLLSHRLVKPHELNMDGIFGALPNVAWTSLGPVDPANLTQVQLKARASGTPLQVFSLDKFPRMTDYVTPSGVRVADADRVRLGAHLAEGTTVMHEGFVNFNAGTLGHSMVEGRISRGRGRRRRLRRRRRQLDHGHAVRRRQRGDHRSASAACSAPTPGSASASATTARSRPGSTSRPARWSRCPTARSSRAAT